MVFNSLMESLRMRCQCLRLLVLVVSLGFSLGACSLFIGNVKPIEEHAKNYGVLDLSARNPDWVRLDPGSLGGDRPGYANKDSSVSDQVFQSKSTASIISVNSTCRSYSAGDTVHSLSDLTRGLLLGITDVKFKREAPLTVNGIPALQTTIQGQLNDETMTLRTVVVQRQNCVYDLMLIARPNHFGASEKIFAEFVSSLYLR